MAGYVLYGYRGSGSAAIEVAMVDCGIPFEFRDVNPETGALYSEAFRVVNSRQQVPALMHPDGSVITEVPAILNHLADAHPQTGLAPKPGTSARAQHDRWLAFLHANVYEGLLRVIYTERYTTDPTAVYSVRKSAEAYVARHLGLFGEAIEEGPFLFGEHPSAVDFLAWVLSTWMDPLQVANASRKVARLAEALRTRTAVSEVIVSNT